MKFGSAREARRRGVRKHRAEHFKSLPTETNRRSRRAAKAMKAKLKRKK